MSEQRVDDDTRIADQERLVRCAELSSVVLGSDEPAEIFESVLKDLILELP